MKHIRTALALLFGVAAFAVPTAGAALDPGPGNLPGEPGVFLRGSVPGDEPGPVLRRSAPPGQIHPKVYWSNGTSEPLAPANRSRLGFKAPVTNPTSPNARGIDVDWADAGIGAGAAFGSVLLLAGAFLVTRQLGRPATA